MSRPRSKALDWLPKYCYVQRKRIVYLPPGGEQARLCTVSEATRELVVKRLAEHLDTRPDTSTLRWLCEQYNESAKFNKLSASTRKAYGYHHSAIVNFAGKGGMLMGDASYLQISTGLLQRYLDKRAEQASPIAGNREIKGYLSAVYTWAIRREHVPKGFTNPCRGVEANPKGEDSRGYVEDWEFDYALARATPRYVHLWMWLAYLLAARTTEVLKLQRGDLTSDGVRVRRLKGSKTNVVKWSPLLEQVVNEALALPGEVSSVYLLHDDDGQPITYSALRGSWDRLMAGCAKDAQQDGLVWTPFKRHHLKKKGTTDHAKGTIAGHKTEQMRNLYRVREELEEPVR